MSSLSARLLLSVSLLLLFFFGATIVVLDTAFRKAAEQAQEDILDGQLVALLAAAEPNIYGELEMPVELHEVRFSTLDSGLFAELRDESDTPVWRSHSSLGLNVPYGALPRAGAHQFSRVNLEDGTPLRALRLSVDWELVNGDTRAYTFSVAESLDSFHAQLAKFRRQLFSWFFAVAVIMLFGISWVLRGNLKPLRKIEEEISEVEGGGRQQLSDGYPTELQGVARNMNVLIGSERARSERYRHTLDNLAHSLKTPLAAIRSILGEQEKSEASGRIEAQIERMNDIVRYQLRKPASYASDAIGYSTVDVQNEISKLVDALTKVYTDKNVTIDVDVNAGSAFRGEPGDFMEVVGNILDNACKWCVSKVSVTADADTTNADGKPLLRISVSDDGPGIPEQAVDQLLRRGMRLDESAPGHGIGLAVVKDIVASYNGEINIKKSSLGGATVVVTLVAAV